MPRQSSCHLNAGYHASNNQVIPCTLLSRSRKPLDFDTLIVIYDTSITVYFRSTPLSTPVLNISRLFPDFQSLTLMLKVPNSWKVSTTRRFGQYAWTSWPIDQLKISWQIFGPWDLQPLDWLVTHWQWQNTMTIIMFTVTLLLQRTSLYPVVTQDTRQPITRTIWVSCLSCFLHDSEPLTRTSS